MSPSHVQVEIAKLYQEAKVNPLAGCLPTLITLPVWIGLYRALSNVADEGLLTEGFFWIPSLAGPTSTAAQKAVSCRREGPLALLRECFIQESAIPSPQMPPHPLLTPRGIPRKLPPCTSWTPDRRRGPLPLPQKLQGACVASGHVGNFSQSAEPLLTHHFLGAKPGPQGQVSGSGAGVCEGLCHSRLHQWPSYGAGRLPIRP